MEKPILYILLRNELASMTAGRAAAQASHITSVFTAQAEMCGVDEVREQYRAWERESSSHYFGTAIVLGVTEYQLRDVLGESEDFLSDLVVDDTYAVQDGFFTHYVKLLVGGYVFMHKDFPPLLKEKMDELQLF